jgi:D-xylose reductase
VFEEFGFGPMPYVGGAAVRTSVVGSTVMTANESPSSAPIPPHHELSQTADPPTHISFFCETPAASGGETPLYDSRAICAHLRASNPELYALLKDQGVRYTRVMPSENDSSSAIGRSWKSTYNCETKEEAEAAMASQGTEVEWLPDGSAKTTTCALPAIRVDAVSGSEVFFNSVLAAVTGWSDSRNDPRKAVTLGNDSAVDVDALVRLAEWAEASARVPLAWEAGDVVVIDNCVTMHSRATFTGERRVLAALGRGVYPTPARAAALAAAVPTVELAAPAVAGGEAARMPSLGLGCWKIPRESTAETVCSAIRCGWRALDCAADYANEREVGEGIRLAVARGHIGGRGELFITSKLWNTDHHPDHVPAGLAKTLADLGTDYLDLYLVHFPIALEHVPHADKYPAGWVHHHSGAAAEPSMKLARVPHADTWKAMEELCISRQTRHIGVCNFNVALLRDLLASCRLPPAVLQVELHPFLQQPKLVRFCAEHGIAVTGFSPLGAGSYVALGMATDADSALRHPEIAAIALKHRITPAQVCLRWGLQRGVTLVPKTTKIIRMLENIDLATIHLSPEDMRTIASLDQHRRFNDPGVFCELAFGTFCPIYD